MQPSINIANLQDHLGKLTLHCSDFSAMNSPSMIDLPLEILWQILSSIPSTEQLSYSLVHPSFYQILKARYATLKIAQIPSPISLEQKEMVSAALKIRHGAIQKLIFQSSNLHAEALKEVLKDLPPLEQLSLRSFNFLNFSTQEVAQEAVSPFTSFASLKIKQIDFSYSNISDQQLHYFCQLNPSLKALQLNCCAYITDIGLRSLNLCPHLCHLDLSARLRALPQITMRGILSLASSSMTSLNLQNHAHLDLDIAELLARFPSLTHLDLNGCQVTLRQNLSSKPLLLEFLDLSYCKELDEEQIACLLMRCPYLKTLKLRQTQITGAAFAQLKLSQLENVDLSQCDGFTDEGLFQLLQRNPRLYALNVSMCSLIKGEGLDQLSSFLNLEKIDFTECPLNDSGLLWLLQKSPKLKQLKLFNCKHLTGKGLEERPLQLTSLESLDLSYCERLQDEGLASLLGYTPNLKGLRLKGCSTRGSKFFNLIRQQYPLKSFSIPPTSTLHQLGNSLGNPCWYMLQQGGVFELFSKAS